MTTTQVEHATRLRYEIHPDPEETRRACSAITQAVLPRSRADLIMFFLFVGVAVAAFYLAPETLPATAAIGFFAVAGTALALQLDARFRLKHLRQNDPHATETHYVELTRDGVRTWCAHVDIRYPWQDFTKVFENNEFFLFVRASGAGTAVPKRLLDERRESELRQYLRIWNVLPSAE